MLLDDLQLDFTKTVRCYNGAFDSASQRVLNDRDTLLKEIQKAVPEARVTYHPGDEEYVVHVWGRPLSGYHKTYAAALLEAFNNVFSRKDL